MGDWFETLGVASLAGVALGLRYRIAAIVFASLIGFAAVVILGFADGAASLTAILTGICAVVALQTASLAVAYVCTVLRM